MSNDWIYESPLGKRVANIFDSIEQANNEQGLVDWVKLSGNDGDNEGWVNAVKEHLNIRQYGAKGEGLSPDTLAFQRAVAVGRGFRIPKGRYRLNGTLTPKGALTGSVNLGDYGLIADGVTNDFQALQRAIASGLSVVIPDGIYMLEGDLTLAQAVDLVIELNIDNFGAKGDGVTDDIIAINKALQAGAGRTVTASAKTYLISDTIYLPPATLLKGQSFGDNYRSSVFLPSTSARGTRFLTTGAGVARIRTDQALEATGANDLIDPATTAMIMGLGEACCLENLVLETDAQNGWNYGIFLPSIRRVQINKVETKGNFAQVSGASWHASGTGLMADATWSADTATTTGNTKLLDLWKNTYGIEVFSGGALNELSVTNCWLQGGQWGMMVKGTNRSATTVSANPGIWSPGGVSDITAYNVRFGNTPTGTAPDWGINNGGFYGDSHVSNNWYFYGCSFRAGAYSVFLDRVSNATFHMYGEFRPDRTVTSEVNLTVDALGVVTDSRDVYVGYRWDTAPFKRVYLTNTTRLDTLALGLKHDVYLTTPTGRCTVRSYEYDATAGRAYLLILPTITLPDGTSTGTITAGQTITQPAGLTTGGGFYTTDRTGRIMTIGQSTFRNGDNIAVALTYGGLLVDGALRSRGIEDTGVELNLGSRDSVNINCETQTQVNVWLNRFGTSGITPQRYRFGATFDTYEVADLGSTTRRWGVGYLTSLNVSDATTTRTNLGLGTAATTTYETGTFTPVLQGSTTAGVNTYTVQSGEYVKVGRQVTCYMRLQLSAVGTAGNAMAGNAQISGLPFAISQTPISSVAVNGVFGVTSTAGDDYYLQLANGTVVPFNRNRISAGVTAGGGVPVTDITNTTQFRVAFSYLAAT